MILIYNNKGILIPVFIIVPLFVCILINGFLKNYVGGVFSYDYDFQIVLGIGLLFSSLWIYLTSHDLIKTNGKKEKIEMNNHFFYIPNRFWTYIILVAAILLLIGGIIETFN
ncbi:hypothetical protein [Spongiivirga citrea]|uniref:Uncharacterized protein n=1 Tax=Spongiivirga citrea TaxID=1481457 RepID=A0A6M0CR42_9FLAO|nr:hypothetical protein [Spongiivirga citrea]NER17987.1 hypothetical protein [Spongiivirga citrea]